MDESSQLVPLTGPRPCSADIPVAGGALYPPNPTSTSADTPSWLVSRSPQSRTQPKLPTNLRRGLVNEVERVGSPATLPEQGITDPGGIPRAMSGAKSGLRGHDFP